ncbi:MAG: hypothetical protein A2X84_02330 [Desulfuromonadaceae bacterium GWC2_58_13]|nr:MAG: hypothetical protein A2X84_02330 [Desulfuromonadaceae bacterium GWC2_58_13]
MMIRVEYPDGTQQLVRPYVLNQLIASKAIARFERSGGWVVLDATVCVRRAAGRSLFNEKNHPTPA